MPPSYALRPSSIRAGRNSRVGTVAAIAAVRTDELAMQTEYLRAADLAVFARGLRCLVGALLSLIFAHPGSIRARRAYGTR